MLSPCKCEMNEKLVEVPLKMNRKHSWQTQYRAQIRGDEGLTHQPAEQFPMVLGQ